MRRIIGVAALLLLAAYGWAWGYNRLLDEIDAQIAQDIERAGAR